MTKLITVLILVFVVANFAAAQDFFLPFMQKAVDPVVVDGVLDEWNFCFPIDVKQETIPENSRAHDWWPEDNVDLSGTIMLMWDDDYLYLGANIRDDIPGVLPQPASWNADAIEIYLANYDVGDVPWDPEDHGGAAVDSDDGRMSFQISFYFDADADTVRVHQYSPVDQDIKTDKSKAVATVWPSDEGYVYEAAIAWEDIQSAKGNTFDLTGGEVLPFTISLYDRDEYDTDDFQGYAFSEREHPAWQGPGKGWQVIEVKDARETPWYKDANPYFKQAAGPITIDGDLDEWNFCFPVDMNQQTIPDYSRAQAWLPDDDEDLSGPIKFMFDENYLYIGAAIRDDLPGVDPVRGDWNADAVELYLGNYDISEMLNAVDHSGYANGNDSLDVQLSFYYVSDVDSVDVKLWNPSDKAGMIRTDATKAVAKEWPDGDGYNLEVALSLQDIANMVDDAGQRTFKFTEHLYDIWPCTFALYDRDEYDVDDFQGYQYVAGENAPYLGPGGGGWEGVEILPVNEYDILQTLWDNYTAVDDKPAQVVANYRLNQNYPNPFNPTTNIEYELQKSENVTLKVFNVLGEEVASLVNGVQSAGVHRVQFDGVDMTGGIYFYQLNTGGYSETHRMVLLK